MGWWMWKLRGLLLGDDCHYYGYTSLILSDFPGISITEQQAQAPKIENVRR
jgi:hypothetical protein